MENSLVALPKEVLSIQDLRTISHSLQNIIKSSFGVKGRQTLLASASGQMVTTSDGTSILLSLRLSHPAAQLILDSIKDFTDAYGDGSKTLVIYLHEALSTIMENCVFLDSNDWASVTYKRKVSICLMEFLSDDILHIFEKVQEVIYAKYCNELGTEVLEKPVHYIIRTFLNGPCSEQSFEHITGLISDFLTGTNNIEFNIILISKFFENSVSVLVSQSYLDSHVGDGIFLQGNFHGHLFSTSDIKFISMQCPLEGTLDSQSSDVIRYSSESTESILMYKIQTVRKFLLHTISSGVTLILISQTAPDYVLQICSQLNISVLACLYQSDLEFLTYLTGKLPITSVCDCLNENNIITGASYGQVRVAGKLFVNIKFNNKCVRWIPKYIFLFAPTEGFCQQLKLQIKKCVKLLQQYIDVSDSPSLVNSANLGPSPKSAISTSLNESQVDVESCCNFKAASYQNTSLVKHSSLERYTNIVAGGGYFENVLARSLECYFHQQNISQQKKFCCILLMKMLRAVPKILYDNLWGNSAYYCQRYLCVDKEVNQLLAEQKIAGFNSQGKVCNPLEYGVVEVLSIKFAGVLAAVNLVKTLLCVDSIIGIKRKKLPGHSEISENLSDCDGAE